MEMQKAETAAYLKKLQNELRSIKDDKALFKAIVNAPFTVKHQAIKLGLGITVFLMVNKKTQTIDRIALSDTEAAEGALEYSVKKFTEIKIPEHYPNNVIARALDTGEHQQTNDWKYLFEPELSAEESRFNQAGAGIGCSVIYPMPDVRDGAAIIFSYYEPPEKITASHHDFMRQYTKLVAEALA